MLTTKNVIVANKASLYALQNHEPGEMAYCEDTGEIYIWDEEYGWSLMTAENKGLELNLYDLNKNVISQLVLYICPFCLLLYPLPLLSWPLSCLVPASNIYPYVP